MFWIARIPNNRTLIWLIALPLHSGHLPQTSADGFACCLSNIGKQSIRQLGQLTSICVWGCFILQKPECGMSVAVRDLRCHSVFPFRQLDCTFLRWALCALDRLTRSLRNEFRKAPTKKSHEKDKHFFWIFLLWFLKLPYFAFRKWYADYIGLLLIEQRWPIDRKMITFCPDVEGRRNIYEFTMSRSIWERTYSLLSSNVHMDLFLSYNRRYEWSTPPNITTDFVHKPCILCNGCNHKVIWQSDGRNAALLQIQRNILSWSSPTSCPFSDPLPLFDETGNESRHLCTTSQWTIHLPCVCVYTNVCLIASLLFDDTTGHKRKCFLVQPDAAQWPFACSISDDADILIVIQVEV